MYRKLNELKGEDRAVRGYQTRCGHWQTAVQISIESGNVAGLISSRVTCFRRKLFVTVNNLQHKPTAPYCAQLVAQTDCPVLCTTCSTNRLPPIVHNL